jgi:hypothetical protein
MTRPTSLLWHREGDVDGKLAKGSNGFTRALSCFPGVGRGRNGEAGALLDDIEEERHDCSHYRPGTIKFPYRHSVHMRDLSFGS